MQTFPTGYRLGRDDLNIQFVKRIGFKYGPLALYDPFYVSYEIGTLAPTSTINGAGQTGSTIAIRPLTIGLAAATIVTFDGITSTFSLAADYTIRDTTIQITPALTTPTVDGGLVTFGSLAYVRVGHEFRKPELVKVGTYRANFIVGDNWAVGDYRIIWKYQLFQTDPLQTYTEDFMVSTSYHAGSSGGLTVTLP